jgi:hypothetical protein
LSFVYHAAPRAPTLQPGGMDGPRCPLPDSNNIRHLHRLIYRSLFVARVILLLHRTVASPEQIRPLLGLLELFVFCLGNEVRPNLPATRHAQRARGKGEERRRGKSGAGVQEKEGGGRQAVIGRARASGQGRASTAVMVTTVPPMQDTMKMALDHAVLGFLLFSQCVIALDTGFPFSLVPASCCTSCRDKTGCTSASHWRPRNTCRRISSSAPPCSYAKDPEHRARGDLIEPQIIPDGLEHAVRAALVSGPLRPSRRPLVVAHVVQLWHPPHVRHWCRCRHNLFDSCLPRLRHLVKLCLCICPGASVAQEKRKQKQQDKVALLSGRLTRERCLTERLSPIE